MATSEAKEIKKQETLVRFNIISYKTRLRVGPLMHKNAGFFKVGLFKNIFQWPHFFYFLGQLYGGQLCELLAHDMNLKK